MCNIFVFMRVLNDIRHLLLMVMLSEELFWTLLDISWQSATKYIFWFSITEDILLQKVSSFDFCLLGAQVIDIVGIVGSAGIGAVVGGAAVALTSFSHIFNVFIAELHVFSSPFFLSVFHASVSHIFFSDSILHSLVIFLFYPLSPHLHPRHSVFLFLPSLQQPPSIFL